MVLDIDIRMQARNFQRVVIRHAIMSHQPSPHFARRADRLRIPHEKPHRDNIACSVFHGLVYNSALQRLCFEL